MIAIEGLKHGIIGVWGNSFEIHYFEIFLICPMRRNKGDQEVQKANLSLNMCALPKRPCETLQRDHLWKLVR